MTQEAIRIPSGGAIFWAEAMPDGSAGMRAIAGTPPVINVTLTSKLPAGLFAIVAARGIVIQRSPLLYDHTPDETDFTTLPSIAAFTVTGVAEPLDGRFHPRRFSVAPSAAAPSYVALRQSLHATRIGEAGAIVLNLRWQDDTVASWSVLRLACARGGQTFGFSGQADRMGDVIVPLTGLPPLPPTLSTDAMSMTAIGDPAQSGKTVSDPDTLAPVKLSLGAVFAAQQTITISRGQVSNAAALSIPGVTLQPS